MTIPAPLEDLDLEKLFQSAVAGITGLPGDLVRPRFQVVPPAQPAPDVNWCAIGDVTDTSDDAPYFDWIAQDPSNPSDPGAMRFIDHERLSILASFYGPQGKAYAKRLRDGIKVPQNMESLEANEIYFQEAQEIRRAPELFNQQWIQRYDLPLLFRRKITRIYPVQNLEIADIHLFDDHPSGKPFFDETVPVPTLKP